MSKLINFAETRNLLRRSIYASFETAAPDSVADRSLALLTLVLDHGMTIERVLSLRSDDIEMCEGKNGELSCSVTYRFDGVHGPMKTTLEVDPIYVSLIQRLVARTSVAKQFSLPAQGRN
jgi:hypothetical protein